MVSWQGLGPACPSPHQVINPPAAAICQTAFHDLSQLVTVTLTTPTAASASQLCLSPVLPKQFMSLTVLDKAFLSCIDVNAHRELH